MIIDDVKSHVEFILDGLKDYEDGVIEMAWGDENNVPRYADKYLLDDLDTLYTHAEKMNRQGRNVYIVPSLQVPDAPAIGRGNASLFYVTNTLWLDVDQDFDGALERTKHCPPNLIVNTGTTPSKRGWFFWKLSEPITDKDELRSALTALIDTVGGDTAGKDATRLCRLGGTVSYPKKDGRIIEQTNTIHGAPEPYDIATIFEHFRLVTVPLIHAKPPIQINVPNQIPPIEVAEHLRNMSADIPREEWLQIGMALHDGGYPFDLWEDWSMTAPNRYNREHAVRDWNSFKAGNGITMGTLIQKCRRQSQVVTMSTQLQRPTQPEIENILPYVEYGDVEAQLKSTTFVEGLLCEQQLSVVYGKSNCGKTFFMTDLALHVAEGRPWRGLNTVKGGVAYLALEGSYGLKNRLAAYRKEYGVETLPFALLTTSINFLEPVTETSNLQKLTNTIVHYAERVGGVRLIVIDTLARALAGGDENSGQDMGLLIARADELRHVTGAHVCFVHHSGKDELKGARGHSSLRAACDTEIEVKRIEDTNVTIAEVTKQRDLERGQVYPFHLKRVDLGVDEAGKVVSSCVVEAGDAPATPPKRLAKPSNKAAPLLRAAQEVLARGEVETYLPFGNAGPAVKAVPWVRVYAELERAGFAPAKADPQAWARYTQAARAELHEKGLLFGDKDRAWV